MGTFLIAANIIPQRLRIMPSSSKATDYAKLFVKLNITPAVVTSLLYHVPRVMSLIYELRAYQLIVRIKQKHWALCFCCTTTALLLWFRHK